MFLNLCDQNRAYSTAKTNLIKNIGILIHVSVTHSHNKSIRSTLGRLSKKYSYHRYILYIIFNDEMFLKPRIRIDLKYEQKIVFFFFLYLLSYLNEHNNLLFKKNSMLILFLCKKKSPSPHSI